MITSQGAHGPNVMSAEWVTQISYDPVLIAAFIHSGSQTLKNIEKTREFGVNVASKEQTSQVSIAGGYSRLETNKLQIKNIFKTTKSKKITAPSISGCTINAECILVKKEKIGDHVMLVGKVVHMKYSDSSSPLIYHKGRYFEIGNTIEPERKEIQVDKNMLSFFKNIEKEKFILKCVGVIVKSKNKILVMQHPNINIQTIPFVNPPAGRDQRNYLVKFLNDMGLDIQVGDKPTMKRLVLRHKKESQRVNLLLYKGRIKSTEWHLWKPRQDEFVSSLI